MQTTFQQALINTFNFARENKFRGCVVLSGSQAWCQQAAMARISLVGQHAELKRRAVFWVGESARMPDGIRVIAPNATAQLLGSDADCLVIDARSGFSPDMLGMVSGTLCGGALLLLLTPPFDQWPTYNDPDYQRYQALRPSPYTMNGYFLQRVVALFEQASMASNTPWLSIVKQSQSAENYVATDEDLRVLDEQTFKTEKRFKASDEQLSVIQAVDKLSQQAKGMILLTADRGRGKSVALGLAVNALLAKNSMTILIVASLRSQVEHFFSAIDDISTSNKIKFVAVDQLIIDAANASADNPLCDLLIVDEAATLPLPVLYQLVDIAPRLAFSSTLHGYEGSGRGFSLRFKQYLLAQDPSLQLLTLKQPIRWASGDPLESFLNKLLILDAETDTKTDSKTDSNPSVVNESKIASSTIVVRAVNSKTLLQDEVLLRAIFTLLVEAHYQTRPADLRQLLDVPYLHLWIAEEINTDGSANKVVGVLLAYEEGGFDAAADDMLNGIVSGQRRPQGNLLSQSIANQSADTQWCRVKSLRVARIAVAQSYRRQGIASRLLNSLEQFARAEACDYWGSSFGFDPDLLAFWQSHQALPVHLGLHRDKSSGMRNLMVVKALSKSLDKMSRSLYQQFIIDLPFWGKRYLEDMPTKAIKCLSNDGFKFSYMGEGKGEGESEDEYHSQLVPSEQQSKAYDHFRIQRFINAELPYDKIYPSLCRILLAANKAPINYPITHSSLLLAPNWLALADKFQLNGRRDVIASIKAELIQLTTD